MAETPVEATLQGNKELIRRFIEEGQNRHDYDLIDAFSTEDCVIHHPAARKPASEADDRRRMAEELWEAFSDFRFGIEDMVAEGDWVAVRLTAHATNDGPLGPNKDVSGKTVAQPVQVHYRLRDGKIAEVWIEEDVYGMLLQLGLIPKSPRLLHWMNRLGIMRLLQMAGKVPKEDPSYQLS